MTVDTTLPVYRNRQREGLGSFEDTTRLRGDSVVVEDTTAGRLGNVEHDTTGGSGVDRPTGTPPEPGDTGRGGRDTTAGSDSL
ncbi:MAG TPA: hypothetical protein VNK43_05315 [Gemmatimonadales bacterium]|nr:hypothetical protein [Gemmatimonadales bacterium]